LPNPDSQQLESQEAVLGSKRRQRQLFGEGRSVGNQLPCAVAFAPVVFLSWLLGSVQYAAAILEAAAVPR
jgi:hypothetical protein